MTAGLRLIGHTMGTPEYTYGSAFALFAGLGLDGTEIAAMRPDEVSSRFGDRQGGIPPIFRLPVWHGMSEHDRDYVRSAADDAGIAIATLTPYVKAFNWYVERKVADAARDELMATIDLADQFGAEYVRVYGGREVDDEEAGWALAVEALVQLGEHAGERDITLLIENHPGTMTVTGEATARLVGDVGLASVRALYDPANVLQHSEEPWQRTLEIQREIIAYVHVKDFSFDAYGKRVACTVGAGKVPWPDIVRGLQSMDSIPPMSFEYERLWNQDQLPDARYGMKESAEKIRSLFT